MRIVVVWLSDEIFIVCVFRHLGTPPQMALDLKNTKLHNQFHQAMTTLSQIRGAEKSRQQRILWLADNVGVLSRIAEEFSVSQPYVSDIYHGRRPANSETGEGIKARLAALGAPGFGQVAA